VEGTPESETLARLFRHKALRILLEEGVLAKGVVRNLLAWPHTGFGAHVSRAILADATTPGIVARNMTQPPITPERMLGEANRAQLIYRSNAVHPRHQANFRSAELATKPRLRSPGLPRRGERPHPRRPREDHAVLRLVLESEGLPQAAIRQVYEMDPLLCAGCGGTMKILAVIERPAIVRQILAHLGLPTGATSLRAPPDPARGQAADQPRGDPTNPSLTTSPSLIQCPDSRGRGAGLLRPASPLPEAA
jgi:hypothetical protein